MHVSGSSTAIVIGALSRLVVLGKQDIPSGWPCSSASSPCSSAPLLAAAICVADAKVIA
jgi:hypothetical protein